ERDCVALAQARIDAARHLAQERLEEGGRELIELAHVVRRHRRAFDELLGCQIHDTSEGQRGVEPRWRCDAGPGGLSLWPIRAIAYVGSTRKKRYGWPYAATLRPRTCHSKTFRRSSSAWSMPV